MNTWNCTHCETPHDAPALVMSEFGLPFCNDLCKTAYERDSEVDEMCAQFDETSKCIAEWRENRQAVFSGLRADSVETVNELLQHIQALEKALKPFVQTWDDWEATAIDDSYSFEGFFNARCDWDMFAVNCERAAQVIASIAEWREARELVFERLREPLKPTFNFERLLRRESELTASVHELLAIVELAAFYMPGELKEQPEKVHAAIDRAQALVNEESYNA